MTKIEDYRFYLWLFFYNHPYDTWSRDFLYPGIWLNTVGMNKDRIKQGIIFGFVVEEEKSRYRFICIPPDDITYTDQNLPEELKSLEPYYQPERSVEDLPWYIL